MGGSTLGQQNDARGADERKAAQQIRMMLEYCSEEARKAGLGMAALLIGAALEAVDETLGRGKRDDADIPPKTGKRH
jgi:hypothetical protein